MRTSALFAPLSLLFACAAPVDAPPPSAHVGAMSRVALGEEVSLDAEGSRGVELSFDWSLVATPTGSLLDERGLLGARTSSAAFTPDVPGSYVIALQACDAWRRCAISEVAIEVEQASLLRFSESAPGLTGGLDNRPPQARAQASIGRSGGSAGPWVFLNGQLSSDPDGDRLRYGWSFASRPADSTISPADIEGQGEELAAFQPDVAGTWVLRLTVSDLSTSSTAILADILINEAAWAGDLPE